MTMTQDFYISAALQRQNELEAERQAALADLAAHKANNDYAAASATVQSLANLQAEATNLKNLCDNYIASQQPRQPERLSDEEKAAKPIHRMNYDDVLDMARTSKYAKDLTWNADMQAGYDEVRARRSRGE
jgi:aspartyl/asparaginyl-tRNA synthetase